MTPRFVSIGIIALVSAVAASSVPPLRDHAPRMRAAPGSAHLRAVGGRSPQQRRSAIDAKLDNTLADLSRHAAGAQSLAELLLIPDCP